MDLVAATQRQVIFRAAVIALVLAGLAALSGRWPAALSVLVGCFVSILNFRLLALGIIKLLDLSPHAARVQAVIRYIIRYTLTILVLWSVNSNPSMNLYAAVVGLLLIKVAILGEAVIAFLGTHIRSLLDFASAEKR
jgi:hypothetical protein